MKYSIVVSLNNHNLIGENDKLLIHSKKDLKNFMKITAGKSTAGKSTAGKSTAGKSTAGKSTAGKSDDKNIVIMGYKTWLSIPEGKRPLKDRINIVLTRNHTLEEIDDVKSFKSLENALFWSSKLDGEIFVIGGTQIFNECCKEEHYLNLDKLYITRFNDNYHPRNSTHSFPLKLFNEMKLVKQSAINHEMCERPHLESSKSFLDMYLKEESSKSVSFTFDIYQRLDKINKDEYQYLDLLKKVMKEGLETESRNSKVYSLFGERMVFNLQSGFPLLTTKQVGFKTILRELLWFINGSTSNKELTDQKVHIWTQNSSIEFLDSRNLNYEEGDLGPVYGFQWRHFGAEYVDKDTDYSGKGIDQLQNVIDLITNDPMSRRIIMNSWNASDLDKMALPPCHVMCQFNVNAKERTLDCQLYQRSGDMFLGVPFNIASYAFLTHIIAKITGYQVGKLIHVLGDAHIYESHLDAVKEQLERIPNEFPELTISDDLSDIDDIKEEYFTIKNYHHYDKITVPMIA